MSLSQALDSEKEFHAFSVIYVIRNIRIQRRIASKFIYENNNIRYFAVRAYGGLVTHFSLDICHRSPSAPATPEQ